MARLLIVEDEAAILLPLQDDLELSGFTVEVARTGRDGLTLALTGRFDLVILDVMVPEVDGFEVCRRIRAAEIATPILMLTARSQEIDKVLGLELGADDYMTKPFSPRELQARIKALLRRQGARRRAPSPDRCEFGRIRVDFRKYEATRDDHLVDLTTREFDLLRFLIQHRDTVVSREQILEAIWGEPGTVYPRTVDTHVANLRHKLEDDPSAPRWIVGVRGVGYRFAG